MDNETIKAVADATSEVAKITSKALDGAQSLGAFLYRVLGEPLENGVGFLVGDRWRFARQKQQLALAAETEKLVRERGVTETRTVPPKVALPLLEAASIEDEPDLVKMWTELLATAMDPTRAPVEKKLVSILEELSGRDARVLAALYAGWQTAEPREPELGAGVGYGRGVDGLGSHDPVSIITLNRLGLIMPSDMRFTVPTAAESAFGGPVSLFGEPVTVVGNLEVVALTELGVAFCEAVGLKAQK